MDTTIDTFAIFHRTLYTSKLLHQKTLTPETVYTKEYLHQRFLHEEPFYTRKPFYIHQKSITRQTVCTCTKRTTKGNLSQKPFKPEYFYTRQLLSPESLPQPRNHVHLGCEFFMGFFVAFEKIPLLINLVQEAAKGDILKPIVNNGRFTSV